ncbi:MAG: hypothetical protein NC418_08205 [Muribaculaceae bacterium]|nr:hypothetical protein [Muribaculaceae bacterium]
MTTPLITWSIITGFFIAVVIARLARAAVRCSRGEHRIVEIGSEREEIFLPGDIIRIDEHDYDDFDDL